MASANGANGRSDIEGKTARGAASECGQRASFNGATGVSDMAGKAAMVAVEPSGSERDTSGDRGSDKLGRVGRGRHGPGIRNAATVRNPLSAIGFWVFPSSFP